MTSSEVRLVEVLAQARKKRRKGNKRWIAALTEHLREVRGLISVMEEVEAAPDREESIMAGIVDDLLRGGVDHLASLDVDELRVWVSLTARTRILEHSRQERVASAAARPQCSVTLRPELVEAFALLTPIEKESIVRFLRDESFDEVARRVGEETLRGVLVRGALRALSRLRHLLPNEVMA